MKMSMDAGIGTHMDAPSHCIQGGKCIHDFDVNDLCMPCSFMSLKSFMRFTPCSLNILKTPKGDKGYQWVLEHAFWKYFISSTPMIELNKRFEQIKRDN